MRKGAKPGEITVCFNRRIGISSKDEFDRLYRLTEDARMNAANKMRDLEHHIADHDC
jgi:hypothetical protein